MIIELPDKDMNSAREKLRAKYRVIEFVSANDVYK
jgi:GTP pyrophosphokinase